MRIVQVISAIATSHGGPARGSVEINRALRALGHDAVLLTTTVDRQGPTLSTEDVAALSGEGTSVVAYPASPPRRLENSWQLVRRIYGVVRKADLVHIHGQYLPPQIMAYLSARWAGVPYGFQPHGSLEPYQRAHSKRRKWVYWVLIGRRMLQRAAYVQFASEAEANNARDIVASDQVRVAPLGASEHEEVVRTDVQEWLEDAGRQQVYLFLGRLARKKRPDLLIDAWAEAGIGPGARLVVAGADGELTATQLRSRARELGVDDSVYVAGEVTPGEGSWLYRRAGVFVLPSENENFAVTVAEAMRAGCYCIVTESVAASVHLRAADTGRVLSDVSQLAEALVAARADAEAIAAAGERAAEYARRRFSWEAIARSIAGHGEAAG